jgi:hypothetical protein
MLDYKTKVLKSKRDIYSQLVAVAFALVDSIWLPIMVLVKNVVD